MTQAQNEYLLRIEAINLESFILDSDDLSTIRGAGLLLLGVHDLLSGHLTLGDHASFNPNEARCDLEWWFDVATEDFVRLELISKGASILLYRFDATDDVAKKLAGEVSDWLRTHPILCHATFAVDYAQIVEKNFRNAVESVLQKVRLRQMRSPTVAFAPLQSKSDTRDTYCDIDGKRPGVTNLKTLNDGVGKLTARAKALDKNWVSAATEVRRKYGRFTKLRVYQMFGETAKVTDSPDWENFLEPAWEFQDIAARGERLVDDDPCREFDPWRRLKDKLAVLYIDGNKFSHQIRGFAETIPRYREVDEQLQSQRAELLAGLCQRMLANPHWQVTYDPPVRRGDDEKPATKKRLRIETLLWGGDELIWVVPAWCGLEVAQYFFEKSREWKLHPDDKGQGNLTHAVGMVLCSHKSPIRSVVRLAKKLADSVKHNITTDDPANYRGPQANALAYQVLESFDHLGEDVAAARKRQRFFGMTEADAILSAERLNGLITHMKELRQAKLPRTRLHQIAQVLHRPDILVPKTTESNYAKLIRRIAATSKVSEDLLDFPLPPQAGESLPAKWFHLVELWDYLGSAGDETLCNYSEGESTEVVVS